MSVTVTSTTDSDEVVLAAIGGKLPELAPEEKIKSASPEPEAKEKDESTEESDSSESVDDAETEDHEEDEGLKDEEEKPRKKNGFKKRIDKLNRRISEKDMEIEYLKRVAFERQSSEELKAKDSVKKSEQAIGEPKAEDFDSHADYVKALSKWAWDQNKQEDEAKTKETQLKSEFQKQAESYKAKTEEFKSKVLDFDDVIEEVADIKISLALEDAILSSELGPQVTYELAKNRSELERINRLAPIHAAREIGRIEARINAASKASKPSEKMQTKAPPPISPVGSKGAGALQKDPESMSFKEFKKWRETN